MVNLTPQNSGIAAAQLSMMPFAQVDSIENSTHLIGTVSESGCEILWPVRVNVPGGGKAEEVAQSLKQALDQLVSNLE